MIYPTEADIGRLVIYRRRGYPDLEEHGVLTRFNEDYAFVRYGGDHHSKATPCINLVWGDADDEDQGPVEIFKLWW